MAEALDVIDDLENQRPPFNEPWPSWEPDPSWGNPALPDGWDKPRLSCCCRLGFMLMPDPAANQSTPSTLALSRSSRCAS